MSRKATKVYVVTAPESIRGVYDSWSACETAVSGVSGARYQSVGTRREAEAILRGETTFLPVGTYAFIDGNHLGGIGVVFVQQELQRRVVKEISTSAVEVFSEKRIAMLDSPVAIAEALSRIGNVLAELGGLSRALEQVAQGTTLTVVHDFEGVGAWLEGRWKARDPIVAAVVSDCRAVISRRGLSVMFRHQQGHQSTFAARNDFARFNARADALARQAGQQPRESVYSEPIGIPEPAAKIR